MSAKEAQTIANNKNLDLVMISPNANPPVCKIMDYGKYKYEQSRKEKESKKKQKVVNIKEVRLRPGIEANDLNTKANQAIKFLKKGDKVKVELRFRGRELGHKDIGKEVMLKFIDIVKEFGEPTKAPAFEGNNMPKMKTHRGAAKRFKKTGTGKLKRAKAFRRHILTKKAAKTKMQLRKSGIVTAGDARRIAQLLPY